MFDNVKIADYRGVKGLVAAEVLVDDNEIGEGHGYVTDEVFAIAGVANITKASEVSTTAKYYNNVAAIITQGVSPDNIEIQCSAIPVAVQGKITGQKYDTTTGALIESTDRPLKYFAIGYVTETTDGKENYVWRYKGNLALGEQVSITKDDGTESNGQTITFTGINTNHVFEANDNKSATGTVLDASLGLVDLTNFFTTVTTPDDITPIVPPTPVYYTVSYNANGGTGDISPVTVLAGSSIQLDGGTDLTPPTDKVFAGWAKTSGAASPTVESPFKPTADTTLYAVYVDA